jgi:zinc D-Ala-D-Ala dipeptidase
VKSLTTVGIFFQFYNILQLLKTSKLFKKFDLKLMNRIYKIKYWLQFFAVALLVNFIAVIPVSGQSKTLNKYGLFVVKDSKTLKQEIKQDSNKQMFDLLRLIPGLVLDLKYATEDNFMYQKLYPPVTTTFLRKPAADSLKKVVEELKKENSGIKIFDAYRPYSVTEKMWDTVKDDRYAADPSKGSGHNRGTAVDLTLIDLNTKKELPMGTDFDNFSDTAHIDFAHLPADVLNNRNRLRKVMEKYGFIQLTTEWWHYYLPHSSSYELLDLSFADLRKMGKKRGK